MFTELADKWDREAAAVERDESDFNRGLAAAARACAEDLRRAIDGRNIISAPKTE